MELTNLLSALLYALTYGLVVALVVYIIVWVVNLVIHIPEVSRRQLAAIAGALAALLVLIDKIS